MEVKDLASRIRYIEVITRKKVDEALSGAYSSVFKGRGIEFAEVRDYIPGDDISAIDWNVTARYGRPFTKKFVEERQLNIALAVDNSMSMNYSFNEPTKKDLVAEVCGAIGFSSLRNNDRLSLFTFADKVYKSIHPRRGRSHVLRILREVLVGGIDAKRSSIREAIRYLLDVLKKRAVVFLISDFFCDEDFWKDIKILNRRHDVIAVIVRDDFEMALPFGVGRLYLEDPETGNSLVVNTAKAGIVKEINEKLEREREELFDKMNRAGIDYMLITTSSGWLKPMLSFFKKRELKGQR